MRGRSLFWETAVERAGSIRISFRESLTATRLRGRGWTESLYPTAGRWTGRSVTLFSTVLPFLSLLSHPGAIGAGLCLLSFCFFLLEGGLRARYATADGCVALLAGAYLLSGLLSEGDILPGLLCAAVCLVWFPARAVLQDSAARRRLLLGMRGSFGIVSLIGILQYVTGRAELRWVDTVRFGDIGGRVVSVFSNPNVLAVYLLLMLPLAICGAWEEEGSRVSRRWSAAVAAMGLLCLLLTWSRGAWLGAMLEVVLLLAFGSRETLAAGLLALPFLPGGLLFLPGNILRRFLSIGDLGESSIRYRLLTWRGAVEAILSHPFGVGAGEAAFRAAYLPHAVSGTETVMHAHQLFLQLSLDAGVCGLGAFLLFLICLLRRWLREGGGDGGGVAICGVLVMGLFDHIWYSVGLQGLFWVIAALAGRGGCEEARRRDVGAFS